MALAKPEDVQARLGRPLTSGEQEIAKSVIATVTGLIADAVNQKKDWIEAIDPVPEGLKALCVEKAIGAIVNPANLASQSESLGVHSIARVFPKAGDVSVFLSDFERRQAISAVFGNGCGSAPTVGVVDRVIELREGKEP